MILALALTGFAWLDVVGMPYLPGEMVRHVQVIDSTLAGTASTETWVQPAIRVSEAEATDLAAALEDWVHGTPLPRPPTIWAHKDQVGTVLFTLEVIALPGPTPRCKVRVAALAWIDDGPYCEGCAPAQVFARQEMVLTRAEARGLAEAVSTWLAGEDPDNLIWSKVVQEP